VIGDARFIQLGLRDAGGFIGEHDRDSRAPIPDHISARADDLNSLIEGMVAFDRGPALNLDPVIAAAVLAFGFVYVHPFADGNGRIHRYLIHHVLAERGFSPAGIVFPISATILARIEEYRRTLEHYSQQLMPMIDWRPTADGNVEVLNETADFYRFFDATPNAEFLYSCVQQTIEEDLPREARFLARYDQFRASIEGIVDMPNQTIDLLFRFVHQNGGKLSMRARQNEFSLLTDEEVSAVEAAYQESFTSP
jgi:Fic family protein